MKTIERPSESCAICKGWPEINCMHGVCPICQNERYYDVITKLDEHTHELAIQLHAPTEPTMDEDIIPY